MLHRTRTTNWSDPAHGAAIEAEMQENLRRQHAVRSGERRRRRQPPDVEPPPLDFGTLPITVEEEGPSIYHALTEDEICDLLWLLPEGSLDGIQEVRLCVDRRARHPVGLLAPTNERRPGELLPGVFGSNLLGMYHVETGIVRLYGYVHEPDAITPIVAFYLQARAMHTLVHEVGHHFDRAFRYQRSRWDQRDRASREAWADHIVDKRTGLVAWYLRSEHPGACEAFERWTETHFGARLTALDLLLRMREHDDAPFLDLVRAVQTGRDVDERRLDYAASLHGDGNNTPALAVADSLPEHPRSWALHACIAVCEHRDYERAESLCLRAIERDPACADAWTTLVRTRAIKADWPQTAAACEQALAVCDTDYVHDTLVESYLLAGDFAAFERALERFRRRGERVREDADSYAIVAACWQGRWEEALIAATRALAAGRGPESWLQAVRFEAAHHLGKLHFAGRPRAPIGRLGVLEKAWRPRLDALGASGTPAPDVDDDDDA